MASASYSDDPIDRFCQLIERLPEPERNDLVSFSHMAVGPDTTGHFFVPRLNELREQLQRAVEFGMSPDFLIPGLFLYLIEFYRRGADPDVMQECMENDEVTLARLRADLLVPREQRPTGIPDDQLRDLIEKLEQTHAERRTRREQANRLVGTLEHLRDELFDRNYWRGWLNRRVVR